MKSRRRSIQDNRYLEIIDALFNLGNLYIIKEEYTKAGRVLFKAIASINDVLNSLSWMYFTQGKEKK